MTFPLYNLNTTEVERLNDAEIRRGRPHVGPGHYSPLDLVENFLRRFVIYPSEHAIVAHVFWIAHTHLMDCWDTSPRIAFTSAEKESGKTRALEMTKLFVPAPELFFDPSPAVIVRLVSQGHEHDTEDAVPTLPLDEIDNVFRKGWLTRTTPRCLACLTRAICRGRRCRAASVRTPSST